MRLQGMRDRWYDGVDVIRNDDTGASMGSVGDAWERVCPRWRRLSGSPGHDVTGRQ